MGRDGAKAFKDTFRKPDVGGEFTLDEYYFNIQEI